MAATSNLRKANGLLPIATSSNTEGKKKAKAQASGVKVVVRRLPPGLAHQEFWSILGGDWKQKLDWEEFSAGKVSTDPLKSSKPSTCHLRLIHPEDVDELSTAVQKATWQDARNTFNDSALVGPPYMERALFQKVPVGKSKADPRQGTIDQDPEFIAFLESLTQPQTTARDNETGDPAASNEPADENTKVVTTPLVEYLREKKANKAKEAANAKSAKHARQESQGGKTKGGDEASSSKKKGKESKAEKQDRAAEKDKPKEPVKLLTKKAAAQEAAEVAKNVANQIATSKTAEEAPAKSRRAGIAAAAKILQRDLGLSPGSAHRRARQDAAKAEATAKAEAAKTTEKDVKENREPEGSKAVPTGPKSQAEGSRRSRGNKGKGAAASSDSAKGKTADATKPPTTGPLVLLKKESSKKEESPAGSRTGTPASTAPSTPATAHATASTSAAPTGPKAGGGKGSQKKAAAGPSPGATRAFVKHANPSQGVTEPLLKEALAAFGPVTFVEIDKRKGFAYVDFETPEGLRGAIAASPVSVAQGTVQVLERKDKKPATPTPASVGSAAGEKANTESHGAPEKPKRERGGRGRGRRGGNNAGSSNNDASTDKAVAQGSEAAHAAEKKD